MTSVLKAGRHRVPEGPARRRSALAAAVAIVAGVGDAGGAGAGAVCSPTAGRWHSVYDRKYLTEPSQVSIDHVVALANAWRSGADTWNTGRREAFANDVGSQQLIAGSC